MYSVAIRYSFYLHAIQITTSLAGLNSCSAIKGLYLANTRYMHPVKTTGKWAVLHILEIGRNVQAQQKSNGMAKMF